MFRRNKTSINIGRGVPIEDLNSAIRRIYIVDEDRISHLGCFGTHRQIEIHRPNYHAVPLMLISDKFEFQIMFETQG